MISKAQVKALLPDDFPDRIAEYILDIYNNGKWITAPDTIDNPNKLIILAKVSEGEGAPADLEATRHREGGGNNLPTFECDLTSYGLDNDQANIMAKYVAKVVAFAWNYTVEDWRSSVLWSDTAYGKTDKIVFFRGEISR
jgi:hypothetical protein